MSDVWEGTKMHRHKLTRKRYEDGVAEDTRAMVIRNWKRLGL